MKITVVGGGPAGLYFAILIKVRRPECQIEVWEKNPPDNTFGFGVVFSGQTLSRLAAADAPSHQALTRRLRLWDELHVVAGSETVAIGGNQFSGVARLELLQVLRARCADLGIPIQYGREVEDPAARECDLLVGADGVHSRVREQFAQTFRPTLAEARNAYIWLGTERMFPALTLTFRRHQGGAYVAHSYQYSADHSTFIVEVDPQTFAEHGLDRLDEAATLAHLETVFAADLRGHRLRSNQSRWIRFVSVVNANWVHPRCVLLGDALHTAHFSIGSGTKLALEDSLVLAECLRTGPVDTGLQSFAQQRQSEVLAYQAVARESQAWFESARVLLDLPTPELAYRCVTRSKIDEENLARRAPEFVARYRAWKAAGGGPW